MIMVIALYAFLAATFVLAKNALNHSMPCFLIGFRMVLAGCILLGYQFLTDRKQLVIKRSDLWLFLKTSFFHIYLAFSLEFWALQYVTALKSTLIFSSTPFIAAILSYFLLHERLSWQKVVGIVIGLGGLIPIIVAATNGKGGMVSLGSLSLPDVVLFGAVASGAYAWFLVRELMDRGYALSVINGFAMLVGGVLSFITALFTENLQHPVDAWLPFLGWLLALILVANVIFYNLFGWLLRRYSITFLTFAGFLCPGFGIIYAWLFDGHVVTWHYPLSLCLVTCGLYIFYRQELKSQGIKS